MDTNGQALSAGWPEEAASDHHLVLQTDPPVDLLETSRVMGMPADEIVSFTANPEWIRELSDGRVAVPMAYVVGDDRALSEFDEQGRATIFTMALIYRQVDGEWLQKEAVTFCAGETCPWDDLIEGNQITVRATPYD